MSKPFRKPSKSNKGKSKAIQSKPTNLVAKARWVGKKLNETMTKQMDPSQIVKMVKDVVKQELKRNKEIKSLIEFVNTSIKQ
jgi:hypothetical protein